MVYMTLHFVAAPELLWPHGPPGRTVPDAPRPSLTPFPVAPEDASGAAIVVCPGGGYVHHADHEGKPVARWLNTLGVTAFVLRYRLAPHYRHPAMLEDAARAVRTIRAHASQWRLDANRIGILGFSA